MALDIRTIRDLATSHLMALGLFDSVNAHAPKVIPGMGLHAAVEFDRMFPSRSSGLASTSAVVVLAVSIFANLNQEPADGIDTQIVEAADTVIAACVGDFTLGGNVRSVDVRGSQGGDGLTARAGYERVGEIEARFVTISLPLICNGLWVETP